jgi:transcriptional regulator with XRE-family HTH domain
MNPAQFRAWRKALGWKQKEAAEKLGLKKRMIQYYETGERDGKKVKIPKSVQLACYALSQGVTDYDGEAARHEAPDVGLPADGEPGRAAADGAAQP